MYLVDNTTPKIFTWALEEAWTETDTAEKKCLKSGDNLLRLQNLQSGQDRTRTSGRLASVPRSQQTTWDFESAKWDVTGFTSPWKSFLSVVRWVNTCSTSSVTKSAAEPPKTSLTCKVSRHLRTSQPCKNWDGTSNSFLSWISQLARRWTPAIKEANE